MLFDYSLLIVFHEYVSRFHMVLILTSSSAAAADDDDDGDGDRGETEG